MILKSISNLYRLLRVFFGSLGPASKLPTKVWSEPGSNSANPFTLSSNHAPTHDSLACLGRRRVWREIQFKTACLTMKSRTEKISLPPGSHTSPHPSCCHGFRHTRFTFKGTIEYFWIRDQAWLAAPSVREWLGLIMSHNSASRLPVARPKFKVPTPIR